MLGHGVKNEVRPNYAEDASALSMESGEPAILTVNAFEVVIPFKGASY